MAQLYKINAILDVFGGVGDFRVAAKMDNFVLFSDKDLRMRSIALGIQMTAFCGSFPSSTATRFSAAILAIFVRAVTVELAM